MPAAGAAPHCGPHRTLPRADALGQGPKIVCIFLILDLFIILFYAFAFFIFQPAYLLRLGLVVNTIFSIHYIFVSKHTKMLYVHILHLVFAYFAFCAGYVHMGGAYEVRFFIFIPYFTYLSCYINA